jgi:hypothetical protein
MSDYGLTSKVRKQYNKEYNKGGRDIYYYDNGEKMKYL